MKCAFTECDNKATTNISYKNSKGSLHLCSKCLKFYLQHDDARKKVDKDFYDNNIRKIIEKLVVEDFDSEYYGYIDATKLSKKLGLEEEVEK